MPKIGNAENMNDFKTPATYKFSGVSADELGASEYTLVTICQDESGSVFGFKSEMEKCLKTILEACQVDPRAENQMLRLVTFETDVHELHGFRFLSEINPDEYDGILNPGGGTALFDSVHTAIDATNTYGIDLADNDISVNAIVFVITDGDNNSSKYGADKIKELLAQVRQSEKLESILVVLVGITNGSSTLQGYLDNFKDEAGLDAFIDIGSATKSSLAKLAKFTSQSISSQSQSLGSGGPSQVLTF